MRISTYAAGLVAAIVLAAIVGGAIYLASAPDSQDRTAVTGPAPRTTPGTPQAGTPPAPVPLGSRGSALPAQVPQPLAEKFAEWRVWCTLDVQSRETCRAEQVLKDRDGKAQVGVVVFPAAAGAPARMRIVPPWGVLIEAGVAVRIDTAPAQQVPIRNCLPTGCQAELTLSDSQLQAMRTGTELKIGVITAERNPLSTSMPLAGFSDAYSRIASKTGK